MIKRATSALLQVSSAKDFSQPPPTSSYPPQSLGPALVLLLPTLGANSRLCARDLSRLNEAGTPSPTSLCLGGHAIRNYTIPT